MKGGKKLSYFLLTAASSFSWTDKFNNGISRYRRKFCCSKYKYLKHKDFILFRNFNNFLKHIPWILFLKIKTQSPKEVSWPSQKEFFLCEHLIPTTYLYHREHLPAQPALQRQDQSLRYWNRLTSTFMCRSMFSLRRKLTRDAWPFWVAICKALILSCKR